MSWYGRHCRHRRIAARQDPIIQTMTRKYIKALWTLLGLRSLINKSATPSFGTANDKIPGMKAIEFHFTAFDDCCGPR